MRLAFALVLFLGATALHAGDVYRWKDASGKLHYSDAPPPEVDAVKIGSGNSAPAEAGTEQRRTLVEKDAELRKRKSEQAAAADKAAQDKAQQAQRAKACESARSQLAALESGQRMVRYTASGERVFLDDTERESATRDATRAVADSCK